ncbi:MAG: hypothetical protein KatS3mg060_2298 [Dehalococcoidia bacterium]|nr:MAG: hypothetical protein KatS3mg060_2298 [Dehalococcoidia bacterium]
MLAAPARLLGAMPVALYRSAGCEVVSTVSSRGATSARQAPSLRGRPSEGRIVPPRTRDGDSDER